MMTKHKNTFAFHYKKIPQRQKCALTVAVWTLVAFTVTISLLQTNMRMSSSQSQLRLNRLSVTRELEKIEHEEFHMPPNRRKRSPRAFQRRGNRKPRTAIDEFLDESSDLRYFFFPDNRREYVDPRGILDANNINSTYYYHYPGRRWLDTDGNPIQAHGGGVLYVERTSLYYWYGENKNGPSYHTHEKGTTRVDIIGVNCYSSPDLWTWKNEGIVLPGEETNVSHDLHISNVLERPKVIYNEKNDQYVMWMHVDDSNYTRASVGVAISKTPTGPFTYLYSTRPNGFESRDMTIFKDDDLNAYLIYSSEDNTDLHISRLTDDYLNVTGSMRKILVSQHREAPSVFKYENTYYMVTSGCTGWAPNKALTHAAESIMGPWETLGNPCVGGNKIFKMTTFFSQGTFVLPLKGLPGSFIFMADRWNYAELSDSRYVWLPMSVDGPFDDRMEYNFGFSVWPKVSIYWHRKWRVPSELRIT